MGTASGSTLPVPALVGAFRVPCPSTGMAIFGLMMLSGLHREAKAPRHQRHRWPKPLDVHHSFGIDVRAMFMFIDCYGHESQLDDDDGQCDFNGSVTMRHYDCRQTER